MEQTDVQTDTRLLFLLL